MKKLIEEKEATLHYFLNDDQIEATKKIPREWSKETIIKGLKLRFALGVHGYNYLRDTNYPIPAYSTLTKRLRELKLKFGLFYDVLELLKHKVQSMDNNDNFCVLSVDEMEVSKQLSYDKNSTETFGLVTLGNDNMLGGKLLLVIIRGLKNKWKQVIGCHLTDSSLDNKLFKTFIEQCIKAVESCGIHVLALSSDMGNTNRALWNTLDIKVKKDGIRKNMFEFNNHNIFIMPDICHLLKNLKSSLLKNDIILPKEYCENEGLTSQVVKGSYIVTLWEYEINSQKELRSLHHLKREDIWPSNFEKMHVGAAIRFFSLKTAAAIELGVKLNVLPTNAIATAHFIRLIQEWFSLTTSKMRKTSITKRNKENKYDFLLKIITITENTVFGQGWKPLNAGIIMSTLSIIGICETLFHNSFDFVLSHRLTQDAIENIFSQIRRKAGATPTAFQCLQALKLISTSQFISDVNRSNYCNDNDIFLIDFFKNPGQNNDSQIANNVLCSSNNLYIPSEQFITLTKNKLLSQLDKYELNHLYHLGGSITNYLLKIGCNDCCIFLQDNLLDNQFYGPIKFFSDTLNKGGFKVCCTNLFLLILHCELLYSKHKMFILRNSCIELIKKIISDIDITFPYCSIGCNIKQKIVERFFCIRSYTAVNFSIDCKKRKNMYGTASVKKKKVT